MDQVIDLKDLRLAVAIPSYDGRHHNAMALMDLAKRVPNCTPIASRNSCLTQGFNSCLVEGLRMRDTGEATHFLLLHDDVAPIGSNWFAKLWAAYVTSNAQIISAVVPIKDYRRLTSTAVESHGGKYLPRRLTLSEVHNLGPTFTMPGLLLNTGMMLFSLSEPWLEKMFFTIDNDMVYSKSDDGETVRQPRFEPEDWRFTRDARKAGCERIFATTAVDLEHVGQQRFSSQNHGDGATMHWTADLEWEAAMKGRT